LSAVEIISSAPGTVTAVSTELAGRVIGVVSVTGPGATTLAATHVRPETGVAVTAPNVALVSLTGNGFGLSTRATTAPTVGEG
jgi:hypothetical protein